MGYSIDFSRFSTPTGVGSLSYSNKRVRTLIRFFNHIFINSIQPDINMAEEFVDRYIPETKKFILGSTKGNLKNLNNILFVSDNEKRIKEEFEEKRIFVRY